jgi:hypothetical protein
LRYCRSRFFTFLFFMQKLSVTSSGKNNKSCGIFHHESKKISFAVFCFFYDFLGNLQYSAKHKNYLSYGFTVSPAGFPAVPQPSPQFYTKLPRKMQGVAMWPLAVGEWRLTGIWRGRRRRWSGEGPGRTTGAPRS